MPTPAAKPNLTAAPLLRPQLAQWLARQYARRQLPAASRLLRWCGVLWQPHWKDAPTLFTRERHSRSRMRLDLTDYFQRVAYYRGCYHEREILATAAACIRPGDLVLDGGANIGLLTLFLSHLVGPKGQVIAVEPGPRPLEALRWHVEQNRLTNVRIEPVGLSDEAAEHDYKLPDADNLGAGTLGPMAGRFRGKARDRTRVRTLRADDLLDPTDHRPHFIKLDIEGFELRALRGLSRTIQSRRPAVLSEVNRETLALNAASPDDIAALLLAQGYQMFSLKQLGFLLGRALRLHSITPAQLADQRDVLFLHPGSVHWRRVEPILRFPNTHEGDTQAAAPHPPSGTNASATIAP